MSRYRKNGILEMLQRNMAVKRAPERWQDNHEDGCFDIVVTFEERVFDALLEGEPALLLLVYLNLILLRTARKSIVLVGSTSRVFPAGIQSSSSEP